MRALLQLQPVPGEDPFDTALARGQVDTAAVTCLLCKRKLDTVDILARHVRESKVHLASLETERQRLQDAMT